MKRSIKYLAYASLTLGSQLAFANSKTFTFKYSDDSSIANVTYTYNGNFETDKKFDVTNIDNNQSKKKVVISVNFDSNNSKTIATDFNNLVGGESDVVVRSLHVTNYDDPAYPEKLLFWFQGDITITTVDGNVYTLTNIGLGNNGNYQWWVNSSQGSEAFDSKGKHIVGLTINSGPGFCFTRPTSDINGYDDSANLVGIRTGACS